MGAAHRGRVRRRRAPIRTIPRPRSRRSTYRLVATQVRRAHHRHGGARRHERDRARRTGHRRTARYQELRRRGARAHPGPQPGVDELQPERPGRHADRAVRVPDREPALPREPDPGAQPPQVPLAARRPAPAGRRRRAGSSRSRTNAARQSAITLHSDLEVRAGQVPFRTELGLDVLPVEARVYFKRQLVEPAAGRSSTTTARSTPRTRARTPDASDAAALRDGRRSTPAQSRPPASTSSATVDGSLWIALLLREAGRHRRRGARRGARGARGQDAQPRHRPDPRRRPRRALSPLGRSAQADDVAARLPAAAGARLGLARSDAERPRRRSTARSTADVDRQRARRARDRAAHAPRRERAHALAGPRPARGRRRRPPARARGHEARGAGDHVAAHPGDARRAGEAPLGRDQRGHGQRSGRASSNEVLPNGTGEPDQAVRLAHAPVLPGHGDPDASAPPPVQWTRIDDLFTAGPEVPVPDLAAAARRAAAARPAEAERVHRRPRLGDRALRRRRCTAGGPRRTRCSAPTTTTAAAARATSARARSRPRPRSPPASRSPTRCAPGAAPRRRPSPRARSRSRATCSTATGSSAPRTSRRSSGARPGVDIGRVDVLPAFNPELAPSAPGDAAGAVTLMRDPARRPAAPGRAAARPAVPRRDLRLPRPAPARHDRGLPARADVQADLGLGRHRSRRRARASPRCATR